MTRNPADVLASITSLTSDRILIVVFRKSTIDGRDTCEFATEKRRNENLGDHVLGLLGGSLDGAAIDERTPSTGTRVLALSNGDRMVEVWEKPGSFNHESLNGRVINGYVYRWRSSIADVLGEGS